MVVQLPAYRIEAIAVVCPPSFSRWDAHDLAVFRDFERVPGIQRTPTEPDHLLIRLPVQKRIVGRVQDIEPAAATHIGFELPFGMLGPGQMFGSKGVAVLDDCRVGPGIEWRCLTRRAVRRDRGHGYREQTDVIED